MRRKPTTTWTAPSTSRTSTTRRRPTAGRLDLGSVLDSDARGRAGTGRARARRGVPSTRCGSYAQRPLHRRRRMPRRSPPACGGRSPPNWPTRCARTCPGHASRTASWGARSSAPAPVRGQGRWRVVRFIGVDGYRWMIRCVVNGPQDEHRGAGRGSPKCVGGHRRSPWRHPAAGSHAAAASQLPEPMAAQLSARPPSRPRSRRSRRSRPAAAAASRAGAAAASRARRCSSSAPSPAASCQASSNQRSAVPGRRSARAPRGRRPSRRA